MEKVAKSVDQTKSVWCVILIRVSLINQVLVNDKSIPNVLTKVQMEIVCTVTLTINSTLKPKSVLKFPIRFLNVSIITNQDLVNFVGPDIIL